MSPLLAKETAFEEALIHCDFKYFCYELKPYSFESIYAIKKKFGLSDNYNQNTTNLI